MGFKARSKAKIKAIGLFLVILLASLVVFYLLERYLPLEWPVVKLFSYLGYVDQSGATNLSGIGLLIDYQCSGFFSIFVYLALIFGPITLLSFKRKLKAFFIGLIILYLVNIFRLFLLFWLWPYFGIETMHIFGWIFMSVIIFALWYYWAIKKKN